MSRTGLSRQLQMASGASDESRLDLICLDSDPDQAFLIAKSDQVIRPCVHATGAWEPGLARFIGELLPPRAHVAIGGGHVGLMALQLWRARNDVAEIVVFEPDSVNAALLVLNVAAWGADSVRPVPIALGSRTGLVTLARNPTNTGDNRLWESIPGGLDAGGGDPDLWERQTAVAVALDDVWGDEPLDLIFLDTQGWEPDILRGAETLLLDRRPLVIFEWWPRALEARGVDTGGFLHWLRDTVDMDLAAIPPEASGASNPEIYNSADRRDISRITSVLLEDSDPAAYVELMATPRT